MTAIGAHGIAVLLPAGFEGRIFVRPAPPGATTYPVAQFATFPIPDDVGDFGSGAVNLMRPEDVFATLFEYGPESVGTKLFADRAGHETSRPATSPRPCFAVLSRASPAPSGSSPRPDGPSPSTPSSGATDWVGFSSRG